MRPRIHICAISQEKFEAGDVVVSARIFLRPGKQFVQGRMSIVIILGLGRCPTRQERCQSIDIGFFCGVVIGALIFGGRWRDRAGKLSLSSS